MSSPPARKRPRSPPAAKEALLEGCDNPQPPASSLGYKVRWNSNQQALIEAVQDTAIVLKGRGCLKNLSANSCIKIHGHSLQPLASIPFESPPWSAWVTVPMVAGDCIEIKSSSSSSELSFDIYAASDREARPTVIPMSWQTAADLVEMDYSDIQRRENEKKLKQPVYAHASFYLPTVGDSEDEGENDGLVEHEKSGESPTSRQFDRINGFQVVITGAKGVGKSTCLRYCLNRMLNITSTVAVLDADPGQPEYCLPGVLQLTVVAAPCLVPPHYHMQTDTSQNQVVQSHYFGSVTSASNPNTYLRCVAELVTAYKDLLSNDKFNMLPLIVNLDGWIKELGFDLLTAILQETLRPDHVIQIAGDSLSKALDLSHIVGTSSQLHPCWSYNSLKNHASDNGNGDQQFTQKRLWSRASSIASFENGDANSQKFASDETPLPLSTAIIPSTSSIPATALRSVRLVTYFLNKSVVSDDESAVGAIWDRVSVGWQGIDDPACEIAHLLAAAKPYAVSMDAVTVRFTSSDLHRDIRSDDRIWNAVNGSIVGLCCQENGRHTGERADCTSAALLPCMGLGIVRAIDHVRRLLFVLTPCSVLRTVNCLTLGSNVHLPLECYFRGVHSESFPYISFDVVTNKGLDILGTDPMKSRNSISRRGQGGGAT